MKNGFFALGIAIGLIAGCSHYSGGYGDSSTSARAIACDASPPNQPGCYENTYQKGLLNKLFDKD